MLICFVSHISTSLFKFSCSNFDDTVTFVTACGGIILLLFSKFPPPISESSHEFITSLGFFIVVAISIVQCYSCSTCMLLSGYDVSRDQQIVKRRSSTSIASQGVESIRFLGDNQYGGSSNVNPFEAIKTRNLLARKQTCEEQLRHWSEMLRNTEALMVSQAEMVKNGSLAAITATRIVPHSEVDNIEIFRASNKNSVERNVSAYTALSLSATPSVSPMRTVGHVDSGHETVEQNQEQLQVQVQDQAPQSRAI